MNINTKKIATTLALFLGITCLVFAEDSYVLTNKEYKADKFLHDFRIRMPEQSKRTEEENGVYVYYEHGDLSAQVMAFVKPGGKFKLAEAIRFATMAGEVIEKKETVPDGRYVLILKPRYFRTIYSFARGPDGSWLIVKVSGPAEDISLLKEVALSLKNGGYRAASITLKQQAYQSMFSLLVPAKAKLTAMEPGDSHPDIKFEYQLSIADTVSAAVTKYEPDDSPLKMSELITEYKAKNVLQRKSFKAGHFYLKLRKIGYGDEQGAVYVAKSPSGAYLKLEVRGPGPYAALMARMALSFKIIGEPVAKITKWQSRTVDIAETKFELLLPDGAAPTQYVGEGDVDFVFNRNVGLLDVIRVQLVAVKKNANEQFSMKWAEKHAVDYSDWKVRTRKEISKDVMLVLENGRQRRVSRYMERHGKYFLLTCKGPASTLEYLIRMAEALK